MSASKRWSCSTRGAATAAQYEIRNNSVACPPGNTLVVDLRQSDRDVSLVANDDPSRLMFVTWPEQEVAHVQDPLPERLIISPTRHGPELVMRIPPRYCSVEVYSAGGDIHVAAIKEGTLVVDSGGGDITIGSMAGTFAELHSRGGDVSGNVTAGKVYINTDSHDDKGSGNVHLAKLLSKEAVILTRDLEEDSIPAAVAHPGVPWGSVTVTALYSDEAHIRTGGTSIAIATLSCAREGSMLSDGGNINVDCLDGTMRIISGGGKVDLSVQRNLTAVHVNSMPKFDEGDPASVAAASKGGDIHCRLDPKLQALTALQCSDLNIDESLPFQVLEVKEKSIKGRLGPLPHAAAAIVPSPVATSASIEAGSHVDRSTAAATQPAVPTTGAAGPGKGSAESQEARNASAAHPTEHGQEADSDVAEAGRAAAAEAAAAADPALMKHLVLDAGDNGAIKLTASSWSDGVRNNLRGK